MPDWKTLVGWRSHATLVKSALDLMKAGGSVITNLNDGGVFKTLTEVVCKGIADLWDELVDTLAPNSFVQFAGGVWLALHADDYGDAPLQALRTLGVVRFGRTGTTGNVPIPVNTIVTTEISPGGQKLRYFTTAAAVLPAGQSSVQVAVRAEFTGAAYNVAVGYIKLIETPVGGVETVTNESGWITTEGRSDEQDEPLRSRLRLKWPQLSRGSTADAYRGMALDAGATSVQVDDQHPRGPGTVDVIITGPAGTPSVELLATVQAYIDARRPQCSDVDVVAPQLLQVDVDAIVYLDPDASDDQVTAGQTAAEERAAAFFAGSESLGVAPRAPGDDVALGQLSALLMGVERAYDVVIDLPAHTEVMTQRQLAVAGTIAVDVQRRAAR
jgi:uncharacterized phage protein gp47/JayE